jgi:hypothetical protein
MFQILTVLSALQVANLFETGTYFIEFIVELCAEEKDL